MTHTGINTTPLILHIAFSPPQVVWNFLFFLSLVQYHLTCTHTCTHVHTRTHLHIRTEVYIYIFIHTYIHIYIYIYIYIYIGCLQRNFINVFFKTVEVIQFCRRHTRIFFCDLKFPVLCIPSNSISCQIFIDISSSIAPKTALTYFLSSIKLFRKPRERYDRLKRNLIYIYIVVSKVGDRSRGWLEGSLFNSYNTEV